MGRDAGEEEEAAAMPELAPGLLLCLAGNQEPELCFLWPSAIDRRGPRTPFSLRILYKFSLLYNDCIRSMVHGKASACVKPSSHTACPHEGQAGLPPISGYHVEGQRTPTYQWL